MKERRKRKTGHGKGIAAAHLHLSEINRIQLQRDALLVAMRKGIRILMGAGGALVVAAILDLAIREAGFDSELESKPKKKPS